MLFSFYLYEVKDILKIYWLACIQLGRMLHFVLKVEQFEFQIFFTVHGIKMAAEKHHVHENVDSPCVVEVCSTNRLREVSIITCM